MDEELRVEIRKIALQNAVEHGGKTQNKIVLAKILGTRPDLRTKVKDIIDEISNIVTKVNSITEEEQKKEISRVFPDLLIPKEKVAEEKKELPPLQGAEQGKVVTRFPPEPNGYPHIGHAKAAIINAEYAKMYGGKKILRMDDTNPESERMEYYAAIKVGLEWLGVEYDIVKNTSDDMEIFYQKGIQIIESGNAYVCTCKRENISKNRREMIACDCSRKDLDENKKRWEKMFSKYKQGEAIVRFRGDMSSENTVMRDPVLFRIIEEKHPVVGDKYRVWPSYDFAVAIEDSLDGVTHAFRSKEYELRNELYYALLDSLKMRKPTMMEFSRLEFRGMPVSKRVLKALIDEGKISWFDDPRLPTLEGLKRRGIKSDAIRKFIMSLGFTKSDTLAPFEALESFNRKLIDSESIRLNMVINPKTIRVTGLPKLNYEMPNHPTLDKGKRVVNTDEKILISENDAKEIKIGDVIRLIGLGNIKVIKGNVEFEAEFEGNDIVPDSPKIQWVSKKNAHMIKILIPGEVFIGEEFNEASLEEINAYVEPHYLNLKDGDSIQFIRFGYCRKESQNQAIFTHK